jgi:predicted DCC family thiol-disulfide oxidoreductase YuxK
MGLVWHGMVCYNKYMGISAENGNPLVFYDGNCGICRKIIGKLEPIFLNVAFVPSQDISQYPYLLSQEETHDLINALYLVDVDKQVKYRGFYAFRKLARMKKSTMPIYFLMLLPGVPTIGNLVYKFIAKNRSRLGGSGNSCGL